MPSLLVHIQNEDPILGEVDALPNPTDTMLLIKHPRRKDGKDIHYLDTSVTTIIYPFTRITFIEIMPSEEEEEIISSVRE
jgi:hypothetical protein